MSCTLAGTAAFGQSFKEPALPATSQTQDGTLKLPQVKIDSVRVMVGSRRASKGSTEISGWRESKGHILLPSSKFDLICRISKDQESYSEDFLVRTTIDFLVAPPSPQFQKMTSDQLAREVSWGQVTEMQDLKTALVYSLRSGESRSVVIRGFDLSGVMAAFPIHDDAALWPWLMRINIYVQDRDGNQVGSAHRILSLKPDESRIENR